MARSIISIWTDKARLPLKTSSARLASRQVVMFVILATLVGCNRGGPRPLADSGFQVEFGPHSVASEMISGKPISADIMVKNISPVTWPSKPDSKGRFAVNLAYHWLDRRGNMVIFDGLRTPFPNDVGSGESVRLSASIKPPDSPGTYLLQLTLVQETVAWFPERDGGKLEMRVRVRAADDRTTHSDAETLSKADTSRASKQQLLEKIGKGLSKDQDTKGALTKVEREQSPKPGTESIKREPTQILPQWAVQAGAFPQRQEAEILAKRLRDKKYDAYVVATAVKGKNWYRVRVGRLASRAEAEKLQNVLRTKEGLIQTFPANLR